MRNLNPAWRMLTHMAVWCAFGYIAYTIDYWRSAGDEARFTAIYQNFSSGLAGGGILFVFMHDTIVSLVVAFLRWAFFELRRPDI